MSSVVVTAPARLHFGMLDPAGVGARRFGGFGVAIDGPRVIVEATATGAREVEVEGPQADRAERFASRCREWLGGRPEGIRVVVHEAIPPHMGLGSGTKLGLAVARAIAELAGAATGPAELAAAAGRGARSSVGAWTFDRPGLVVEAGVSRDGILSPLVARHSMPRTWRCVLALARGADGLVGDAEKLAFEDLRATGRDGSDISRLLLTKLLPGLIEGDLAEFGTALTEIQRRVGAMFAAAQGGVYHPSAAPIAEALQRLGAAGVGQSSWGPTVYGIVDGEEAAERIAAGLRDEVGNAAEIAVVDFDRSGARVERRHASVAR